MTIAKQLAELGEGPLSKRRKGKHKPNKDNETSLVKSILAYLHAKGIFAFRNNTGGSTFQNKSEAKYFVKFGEKGAADIIGCKNGQFFAIEAKMPGNKPSEAQEAWLKRAYDAGAICLVAYSIDDVMKHL